MPFTNINDIIDSSLPSIAISRVTLENSGGDLMPPSDPHIVHDLEQPTQKSNNQNAMKTTLRITVADATTKNSLNYLIGNQNLVDLLDIHVAYSISEEQTDFIINRNPTLDTDLMQKSPYGNTISIQPLDNILNPGFSLSPDSLTNKYTQIQKDGTIITYYSFDYEWTWQDNTIPYLSFFACCHINLQRLFDQAPNSITIQPDVISALPKDLLAGNLSSNLVLKNGNIVSTTTAFIDEETSEIWMGPYHTMEDGRIMTGAIHNDESRYVVRRNIPNTRIQDFRIRSYIDKRSISIGEGLTNINDTLSRTASSEKVTFDVENSYFSNISLSKDKLGQARFLFSFDYDKIIENHTLFGGLLKKRGIIDPTDITSNFCTISSLKIFRRRIGGSAETGSKPFLVATTINADTYVPLDPAIPASNFDCNQVDELIVFTSENTATNTLLSNQYVKPGTTPLPIVMSSVGPPLGAIPPVSSLVATNTTRSQVDSAGGEVIGTIEEIVNMYDNSSSGIRYVSGIDKSMSKVTDGYYQYRIEMEIIDKTSDYVLENINILQSGKDELQIYYNEITRPDNFTWKENPHIDYSHEGQTVSTGLHSPGYDVSKLTLALESYLKTLLLFTNETTAALYDPARPATFQALILQIDSLVNPATPNGTLMLIELMDVLINKASESLSIKDLNVLNRLSNSTTLAALQPSRFMDQSPSDLSFKIHNNFSNYFNSNTPKDTYYDFIEFPANSQDLGLKTASNQFFLSRMWQETLALFGAPNQTLDLIFEINGQDFNTGDSFQFTDLGYLAPALVRLNNGATVRNSMSMPSSNASTPNPTPTMDPILAQWATSRNLQSSFVDSSAATYSSTVNGSAPPGGLGNSLTEPITAPGLVNLSEIKMFDFGVVIRNDGRSATFSGFSDPVSEPVNKDNQICDTPVTSDGANPFPLFNRLLEEINPNSYQSGGPYETTGQVTVNEAIARLNRSIRNANTFYTPNNPDSPANRYLTESSQWTPSFLYRGEPHTDLRTPLTPSQMWIMTTPNHMKAITKTGVLPVNVRNTVARAKNSMSAQSEVKLKFFTIDVIEVMTGYEQGLLQKPRWQPLNRSIWNSGINQNLICRLTPYQNSIFGISRDVEHEFPTVDDHFIIQPTEEMVVPTSPLGSNLRPVAIEGSYALDNELAGARENRDEWRLESNWFKGEGF